MSSDAPSPIDFSMRLIDAVESQVTVELRGFEPSTSTSISVRMSGPKCKYARTLPATFGTTALRGEPAAIVVQDPCYWTPELPFLYDLRFEWRDAGGELHAVQRTIGLRRWFSRSHSFYLDNKRTVLRGAHVDRISEAVCEEARRASAAVLAPLPTEAECELADTHGVVVVADLCGHAAEVDAEIRRLADHPSVLVCLLTAGQAKALPRRGSSSRPQIAADLDAGDQGLAHASVGLCDVLVINLNGATTPKEQLPSWAGPMMAIRRSLAPGGIAVKRPQCDILQRDLAPMMDLAGYFV